MTNDNDARGALTLREAAQAVIDAFDHAHASEKYDECRWETFSRSSSTVRLRHALNSSLPAGNGLTVPDGWKLVPVEPTDAMVKIAIGQRDDYPNIRAGGKTYPELETKRAYRAMLNVAPAAPRQPGEMGAGVRDKQTMFIVRKPGLVPRLGRPLGELAASLREWYEGNPGAEIDLLRVWGTSAGTASIDDGREWQSIFDPEAYKAYKAAASAQQDEHSGKGISIWLEDLRRAHEYLDAGKPFFTGKDCAELADLLESLARSTKAAQQDEREAKTAKQRYDAFMEPGEEPSAIERLRFFCSLAMNGQDWIDVESFFDDVLAEQVQADAKQDEREALRPWAEATIRMLFGCDIAHDLSNFQREIDELMDAALALPKQVQADAGAVAFDEWYADNVPDLQRTTYSVEDVETMLRENVRAAYFSRPAAESDKRDAERYRFIRDPENRPEVDCTWNVDGAEEFDRNVDAAMSREQSGGEAK